MGIHASHLKNNCKSTDFDGALRAHDRAFGPAKRWRWTGEVRNELPRPTRPPSAPRPRPAAENHLRTRKVPRLRRWRRVERRPPRRPGTVATRWDGSSLAVAARAPTTVGGGARGRDRSRQGGSPRGLLDNFANAHRARARAGAGAARCTVSRILSPEVRRRRAGGGGADGGAGRAGVGQIA